eukprot:TRINITY_DN7061_c0_g1_i11.p1 TRINITY_DN7061_c0_g1~~TRINITY_DN7061_c0_g1_i11.p1  ORF type:complete len:906 (-),score=119.97 TRINITY_DN7061_c0_g1_i11:337-2724(-)
MHEATKKLPIIGDGDTGWGNALNVKRTVKGYADAGFAGILIEDQVHPKSCGHVKNKAVVDRKEAAMRIMAAVDTREEGRDIIVVARSDARQAESLYEALYRAEMFANEGADILFIDALQSVDEMEQFARIPALRDIPKMANMLEGGKTPILPEKQLEDMGFKLVAYPLSLLSSAIKAMQTSLEHLKQGQIPPEEHLLTFTQLQSVIGFDDYFEQADKYRDAPNTQRRTSSTSTPTSDIPNSLKQSTNTDKKESQSLFNMPKSVRDTIPQKGNQEHVYKSSSSRSKQSAGTGAVGFGSSGKRPSIFGRISSFNQNGQGQKELGSSTNPNQSFGPPKPSIKSASAASTPSASTSTPPPSSPRDSFSPYSKRKPTPTEQWGDGQPLQAAVKEAKQSKESSLKAKPFVASNEQTQTYKSKKEYDAKATPKNKLKDPFKSPLFQKRNQSAMSQVNSMESMQNNLQQQMQQMQQQQMAMEREQAQNYQKTAVAEPFQDIETPDIFAAKQVPEDEDHSKEFRVYANVIDDSAQTRRSSRQSKKEQKQAASHRYTPKSSNNKNGFGSATQNSSQKQQAPSFKEQQQFFEKSRDAILSGSESTNANGNDNGNNRDSIIKEFQEAAAKLESTQQADNEKGRAAGMSQDDSAFFGGMFAGDIDKNNNGDKVQTNGNSSAVEAPRPFIEPDAVLQPGDFRSQKQRTKHPAQTQDWTMSKERSEAGLCNKQMRIKITEIATQKVKYEETFPEQYLKGANKLVPELAGVDLEILMNCANRPGFDQRKPVSDFTTDSGCKVQIWLQSDGK